MFANYNCHTAFGKMIIAVMVKNGDDQLMNRQDAIAVAQSEFGVSCRVEHAFTMSKNWEKVSLMPIWQKDGVSLRECNNMPP